MAASSFEVDTKRVRQAMMELSNKNNQFRKQVSEMDSAKKKVDAHWDGETNEAFNRAFMEDKNYMDQFYDVVHRYCQALEKIVKEYEDAERRTSQIARERTAKK